jgi:hypothetical protein
MNEQTNGVYIWNIVEVEWVCNNKTWMKNGVERTKNAAVYAGE